MVFDTSKFIDRFVQETKANVERLNESLLELEEQPDNTEVMDTIFRAAHTIKGSSRLMKYTPLGDLAHQLEDALDSLRQGKIRLSKKLSDLLFKGFDVIALMLDKLSAGEPIEDCGIEICEELKNATKNNISKEDRVETTESPLPRLPEIKSKSPKKSVTQKIVTEKTEESVIIPGGAADSNLISIPADKLDNLIKIMGEIINSQNRQKLQIDNIRSIETWAKHSLELITGLGRKNNPSTESFKKAKEAATLLNRKIRQQGAIARQETATMELLTNDLQMQSLNLRMLPLNTIFASLKRTVRDLAASFNKEIRFDIQGGETELDKKIIDKLGAPLIHMIRNCIDHGIETPEERQKAGKSRVGTIGLKGGYKGETVSIIISDDGRGIPVEKVKIKALEKKLYTTPELENMTESETINLIFHAGLSTSQLITDLSGRGVGMDVVRKNIVDELKGSIKVKTENSKGTFFFIKLPLTLAVMRILPIIVSDMPLAVPSSLVKEIIRIDNNALIQMGDKKAIRLREHMIPVVHLGKILGLKKNSSSNENDLLILVVRFEDEYTGLIINSLHQEQDMIIKPLPRHLKGNPWVAGAIIMSKTDIINVLHMPNIIRSIRKAKVIHGSQGRDAKEKIMGRILVVDDSISTREIEKNIIESHGYHVDLAGDGIEALEALNKTQYDLIITDVEMPRMDGFSLTRQLRGMENYKDVPVILVTSLDREENRKKGIKAGANAYITKATFDQGNLLKAIQNLIGE
ncbi:MAG: hybrid sensor histidine kinase/response regulator [Desulfobacteraceae bacterium]|nr:hybrid sensor histidine kinase/response regulator [Desulfobacteraceae bacterium]